MKAPPKQINCAMRYSQRLGRAQKLLLRLIGSIPSYCPDTSYDCFHLTIKIILGMFSVGAQKVSPFLQKIMSTDNDGAKFSKYLYRDYCPFSILIIVTAKGIKSTLGQSGSAVDAYFLKKMPTNNYARSYYLEQ